jgi:hypothetical protein
MLRACVVISRRDSSTQPTAQAGFVAADPFRVFRNGSGTFAYKLILYLVAWPGLFRGRPVCPQKCTAHGLSRSVSWRGPWAQVKATTGDRRGAGSRRTGQPIDRQDFCHFVTNNNSSKWLSFMLIMGHLGVFQRRPHADQRPVLFQVTVALLLPNFRSNYGSVADAVAAVPHSGTRGRKRARPTSR